ncbi:pyridoxine 5'-phosphate synthase [Coralliovum pocilloporae]|uniref:pyridoxine 5'-phosphate synthase n=1 Tax=Coralliovum pocilloporae TaxID=3066369 RepID=UPI00330708B6
MSTDLSVNLNAVAMLRNRRDLPWPSVTGMARIVLDAGAHGITIHPRPDERHIRRTDVFELNEVIRSYTYGDREYNIEGYPDERFLSLVEEVKPDQVTLVPDDPSQNTSDHGWDIAANQDLLKTVISRLKTGGMRVSLFVDDDPAIALLARDVGADRVELYTGPYGDMFDEQEKAQLLARLAATAEAARACGLDVNAGHDLTLDNLPPLLARIPFVREVSIGHGLTADALLYGFADATRRYLTCCTPTALAAE